MWDIQARGTWDIQARIEWLKRLRNGLVSEEEIVQIRRELGLQIQRVAAESLWAAAGPRYRAPLPGR